jgi:SAM-dependent methyltransferase
MEFEGALGVPVPEDISRRTIADFGEQWTHYTQNAGWFGSVELLKDFVGPTLDLAALRDKRVAEIGSGNGRIVHMLLQAGAGHVTAIEPSAAFSVLVEKMRPHASRVRCLQVLGEQIPADDPFDFILSLGVIHHIPDPFPTMRAAWRALKPGGQIIVWLYAQEGNELYLAISRPLRSITTRLPHAALAGLAWIIAILMTPYAWLCRIAPLPLRDYMRRVFPNLSPAHRQLIVYDQLNPAYAKYYTAAEARDLLESAAFESVRLWWRHGYSWTVVGERPRGPVSHTQ